MRGVLAAELNRRAVGDRFVDAPEEKESDATLLYRKHLNVHGNASDTVAAGYRWASGTEMMRRTAH